MRLSLAAGFMKPMRQQDLVSTNHTQEGAAVCTSVWVLAGVAGLQNKVLWENQRSHTSFEVGRGKQRTLLCLAFRRVARNNERTSVSKLPAWKARSFIVFKDTMSVPVIALGTCRRSSYQHWNLSYKPACLWSQGQHNDGAEACFSVVFFAASTVLFLLQTCAHTGSHTWDLKLVSGLEECNGVFCCRAKRDVLCLTTNRRIELKSSRAVEQLGPLSDSQQKKYRGLRFQ